MTSTTAAAQVDLDERILAQSALDAAEDNLQSLCASHAGTFVQVERRGKALQEGLAELLGHLDVVQKTTSAAQDVLQQDEDGERPTLALLAEQHRVRRRTLLQHSVSTIQRRLVEMREFLKIKSIFFFDLFPCLNNFGVYSRFWNYWNCHPSWMPVSDPIFTTKP